MTGKATAATRGSTRTKTITTVAPSTTRTTRARAATTQAVTPPIPAAATAAKKSTLRKPLVNRENAVELAPAIGMALPKPPATRKAGKQVNTVSDTDREPVMAYLRIRPRLGEDEPIPLPYLTPLSDTSVRMTDPHDPQNNLSRLRPSTLPPSSIFTFSHIFPPQTSQSDFFIRTTLPLVHDVLQGQNGLFFAYGVTNSGKTYTVQGGAKEGSAGILPRTLDVMFNSIDGLHGDGRFRPVRLHGVEPADAIDSNPPPVAPEPAFAEVLGHHLDMSTSDSDVDSTILKVDRNYEYTIWLSYAEVYNEKVYDLLASVKDDSNTNSDGAIPRMVTGKPILLTRTALPLKTSPASDNIDSEVSGKYISGLRQFRVHSASQAKALVKLGQLHRRVFGTLANRESSRSHGMVTIKVVRGHRGERDDPTALQISRLTLVDLAGSERTKHTHTTGERLKEAGNINKSLMVLGQCMEVMRTNQRKLAMSLAQEGIGKDGRMDTRDVKRGLAVVPFRHSKLTEALMDYFVGNGKAVMIVNVNPYDTGYDENSHVMKFAALAREVYVTPAPAPMLRLPTGLPGKMHGTKIKHLGPMTLKDPEIVPNPYRRKVTISTGGPGSGKKASETILEVLEEDEPDNGRDEDDSDEELINPLVDALFDEVDDLRMQLVESEMRCAVIEAETREEVMREMEARMRDMEAMYSRRLMNELEQNELKTDAKIDMLHQSGLFGSPAKKARTQSAPYDISEEVVEMSLIEYGQDNSNTSTGKFAFDSNGNVVSEYNAKSERTTITRTNTASKKVRGKYIFNVPLPPGSKARDLTGISMEGVDNGDRLAATEMAASESEDDSDEEDEEDGRDAWAPSAASLNNKNKISRAKAKGTAQRPSSPSPDRPHAKNRQMLQNALPRTRLPRLGRETDELSLNGADDSVVILPVKRHRAPIESSSYNNEEVDEDAEIGVVAAKKKKRQLGKKPAVTEEQIERATFAVEKHAMKSGNAQSIRRLGGR